MCPKGEEGPSGPLVSHSVLIQRDTDARTQVSQNLCPKHPDLPSTL